MAALKLLLFFGLIAKALATDNGCCRCTCDCPTTYGPTIATPENPTGTTPTFPTIDDTTVGTTIPISTNPKKCQREYGDVLLTDVSLLSIKVGKTATLDRTYPGYKITCIRSYSVIGGIEKTLHMSILNGGYYCSRVLLQVDVGLHDILGHCEIYGRKLRHGESDGCSEGPTTPRITTNEPTTVIATTVEPTTPAISINPKKCVREYDDVLLADISLLSIKVGKTATLDKSYPGYKITCIRCTTIIGSIEKTLHMNILNGGYYCSLVLLQVDVGLETLFGHCKIYGRKLEYGEIDGCSEGPTTPRITTTESTTVITTTVEPTTPAISTNPKKCLREYGDVLLTDVSLLSIKDGEIATLDKTYPGYKITCIRCYSLIGSIEKTLHISILNGGYYCSLVLLQVDVQFESLLGHCEVYGRKLEYGENDGCSEGPTTPRITTTEPTTVITTTVEPTTPAISTNPKKCLREYGDALLTDVSLLSIKVGETATVDKTYPGYKITCIICSSIIGSIEKTLRMDILNGGYYCSLVLLQVDVGLDTLFGHCKIYGRKLEYGEIDGCTEGPTTPKITTTEPTTVITTTVKPTTPAISTNPKRCLREYGDVLLTDVSLLSIKVGKTATLDETYPGYKITCIRCYSLLGSTEKTLHISILNGGYYCSLVLLEVDVEMHDLLGHCEVYGRKLEYGEPEGCSEGPTTPRITSTEPTTVITTTVEPTTPAISINPKRCLREYGDVLLTDVNLLSIKIGKTATLDKTYPGYKITCISCSSIIGSIEKTLHMDILNGGYYCSQVLLQVDVGLETLFGHCKVYGRKLEYGEIDVCSEGPTTPKITTTEPSTVITTTVKPTTPAISTNPKECLREYGDVLLTDVSLLSIKIGKTATLDKTYPGYKITCISCSSIIGSIEKTLHMDILNGGYYCSQVLLQVDVALETLFGHCKVYGRKLEYGEIDGCSEGPTTPKITTTEPTTVITTTVKPTTPAISTNPTRCLREYGDVLLTDVSLLSIKIGKTATLDRMYPGYKITCIRCYSLLGSIEKTLYMDILNGGYYCSVVLLQVDVGLHDLLGHCKVYGRKLEYGEIDGCSEGPTTPKITTTESTTVITTTVKPTTPAISTNPTRCLREYGDVLLTDVSLLSIKIGKTAILDRTYPGYKITCIRCYSLLGSIEKTLYMDILNGGYYCSVVLLQVDVGLHDLLGHCKVYGRKLNYGEIDGCSEGPTTPKITTTEPTTVITTTVKPTTPAISTNPKRCLREYGDVLLTDVSLLSIKIGKTATLDKTYPGYKITCISCSSIIGSIEKTLHMDILNGGYYCSQVLLQVDVALETLFGHCKVYGRKLEYGEIDGCSEGPTTPKITTTEPTTVITTTVKPTTPAISTNPTRCLREYGDVLLTDVSLLSIKIGKTATLDRMYPGYKITCIRCYSLLGSIEKTLYMDILNGGYYCSVVLLQVDVGLHDLLGHCKVYGRKLEYGEIDGCSEGPTTPKITTTEPTTVITTTVKPTTPAISTNPTRCLREYGDVLLTDVSLLSIKIGKTATLDRTYPGYKITCIRCYSLLGSIEKTLYMDILNGGYYCSVVLLQVDVGLHDLLGHCKVYGRKLNYGEIDGCSEGPTTPKITTTESTTVITTTVKPTTPAISTNPKRCLREYGDVLLTDVSLLSIKIGKTAILDRTYPGYKITCIRCYSLLGSIEKTLYMDILNGGYYCSVVLLQVDVGLHDLLGHCKVYGRKLNYGEIDGCSEGPTTPKITTTEPTTVITTTVKPTTPAISTNPKRCLREYGDVLLTDVSLLSIKIGKTATLDRTYPGYKITCIQCYSILGSVEKLLHMDILNGGYYCSVVLLQVDVGLHDLLGHCKVYGRKLNYGEIDGCSEGPTTPKITTTEPTTVITTTVKPTTPAISTNPKRCLREYGDVLLTDVSLLSIKIGKTATLDRTYPGYKITCIQCYSILGSVEKLLHMDILNGGYYCSVVLLQVDVGLHDLLGHCKVYGRKLNYGEIDGCSEGPTTPKVTTTEPTTVITTTVKPTTPAISTNPKRCLREYGDVLLTDVSLLSIKIGKTATLDRTYPGYKITCIQCYSTLGSVEKLLHMDILNGGYYCSVVLLQVDVGLHDLLGHCKVYGRKLNYGEIDGCSEGPTTPKITTTEPTTVITTTVKPTTPAISTNPKRCLREYGDVLLTDVSLLSIKIGKTATLDRTYPGYKITCIQCYSILGSIEKTLYMDILNGGYYCSVVLLQVDVGLHDLLGHCKVYGRKLNYGETDGCSEGPTTPKITTTESTTVITTTVKPTTPAISTNPKRCLREYGDVLLTDVKLLSIKIGKTATLDRTYPGYKITCIRCYSLLGSIEKTLYMDILNGGYYCSVVLLQVDVGLHDLLGHCKVYGRKLNYGEIDGCSEGPTTPKVTTTEPTTVITTTVKPTTPAISTNPKRCLREYGDVLLTDVSLLSIKIGKTATLDRTYPGYKITCIQCYSILGSVEKTLYMDILNGGYYCSVVLLQVEVGLHDLLGHCKVYGRKLNYGEIDGCSEGPTTPKITTTEPTTVITTTVKPTTPAISTNPKRCLREYGDVLLTDVSLLSIKIGKTATLDRTYPGYKITCIRCYSLLGSIEKTLYMDILNGGYYCSVVLLQVDVGLHDLLGHCKVYGRKLNYGETDGCSEGPTTPKITTTESTTVITTTVKPTTPAISTNPKRCLREYGDVLLTDVKLLSIKIGKTATLDRTYPGYKITCIRCYSLLGSIEKTLYMDILNGGYYCSVVLLQVDVGLHDLLGHCKVYGRKLNYGEIDGCSEGPTTPKITTTEPTTVITTTVKPTTPAISTNPKRCLREYGDVLLTDVSLLSIKIGKTATLDRTYPGYKITCIQCYSILGSIEKTLYMDILNGGYYCSVVLLQVDVGLHDLLGHCKVYGRKLNYGETDGCSEGPTTPKITTTESTTVITTTVKPTTPAISTNPKRCLREYGDVLLTDVKLLSIKIGKTATLDRTYPGYKITCIRCYSLLGSIEKTLYMDILNGGYYCSVVLLQVDVGLHDLLGHCKVYGRKLNYGEIDGCSEGPTTPKITTTEPTTVITTTVKPTTPAISTNPKRCLREYGDVLLTDVSLLSIKIGKTATLDRTYPGYKITCIQCYSILGSIEKTLYMDILNGGYYCSVVLLQVDVGLHDLLGHCKVYGRKLNYGETDGCSEGPTTPKITTTESTTVITTTVKPTTPAISTNPKRCLREYGDVLLTDVKLLSIKIGKTATLDRTYPGYKITCIRCYSLLGSIEKTLYMDILNGGYYCSVVLLQVDVGLHDLLGHCKVYGRKLNYGETDGCSEGPTTPKITTTEPTTVITTTVKPTTPAISTNPKRCLREYGDVLLTDVSLLSIKIGKTATLDRTYPGYKITCIQCYSILGSVEKLLHMDILNGGYYCSVVLLQVDVGLHDLLGHCKVYGRKLNYGETDGCSEGPTTPKITTTESTTVITTTVKPTTPAISTNPKRCLREYGDVLLTDVKLLSIKIGKTATLDRTYPGYKITCIRCYSLLGSIEKTLYMDILNGGYYCSVVLLQVDVGLHDLLGHCKVYGRKLNYGEIDGCSEGPTTPKVTTTESTTVITTTVKPTTPAISTNPKRCLREYGDVLLTDVKLLSIKVGKTATLDKSYPGYKITCIQCYSLVGSAEKSLPISILNGGYYCSLVLLQVDVGLDSLLGHCMVFGRKLEYGENDGCSEGPTTPRMTTTEATTLSTTTVKPNIPPISTNPDKCQREYGDLLLTDVSLLSINVGGTGTLDRTYPGYKITCIRCGTFIGSIEKTLHLSILKGGYYCSGVLLQVNVGLDSLLGHCKVYGRKLQYGEIDGCSEGMATPTITIVPITISTTTAKPNIPSISINPQKCQREYGDLLLSDVSLLSIKIGERATLDRTYPGYKITCIMCGTFIGNLVKTSPMSILNGGYYCSQVVLQVNVGLDNLLGHCKVYGRKLGYGEMDGCSNGPIVGRIAPEPTPVSTTYLKSRSLSISTNPQKCQREYGDVLLTDVKLLTVTVGGKATFVKTYPGYKITCILCGTFIGNIVKTFPISILKGGYYCSEVLLQVNIGLHDLLGHCKVFGRRLQYGEIDGCSDGTPKITPKPITVSTTTVEPTTERTTPVIWTTPSISTNPEKCQRESGDVLLTDISLSSIKVGETAILDKSYPGYKITCIRCYSVIGSIENSLHLSILNGGYYCDRVLLLVNVGVDGLVGRCKVRARKLEYGEIDGCSEGPTTPWITYRPTTPSISTNPEKCQRETGDVLLTDINISSIKVGDSAFLDQTYPGYKITCIRCYSLIGSIEKSLSMSILNGGYYCDRVLVQVNLGSDFLIGRCKVRGRQLQPGELSSCS